MKRAMSLVFACLAAGGLVIAQEAQTKTHTETTVTQSGSGPTAKVKMESVVGTVKEYEAGKKIKISGPNDKTYSFDLDQGAHVDGAIVVGQKARVDYWKDNDGHDRVAVLSEASKASQDAAMMAKSHTEMTTKHEAPDAADTKVKTESVVGVVKVYEAGKKIVVTGPNKKDYSFDLDQQASIDGMVAVGERVKVTYRSGDAGKTVTIIARYMGKA